MDESWWCSKAAAMEGCCEPRPQIVPCRVSICYVEYAASDECISYSSGTKCSTALKYYQQHAKVFATTTASIPARLQRHTEHRNTQPATHC